MTTMWWSGGRCVDDGGGVAVARGFLHLQHEKRRRCEGVAGWGIENESIFVAIVVETMHID